MNREPSKPTDAQAPESFLVAAALRPWRLLGLGLAAWLIPPVAVLSWSWIVKQTPESAAQVGDAFGVSNALLSALAFLAVLVSLSAQQRQSSFQLEEMRRARLQDASPFLAIGGGRDLTLDLPREQTRRSDQSVDKYARLRGKLDVLNIAPNPAIKIEVSWKCKDAEGNVLEEGQGAFSVLLHHDREHEPEERRELPVDVYLNQTTLRRLHRHIVAAQEGARSPTLLVTIQCRTVFGAQVKSRFVFAMRFREQEDQDRVAALVGQWDRPDGPEVQRENEDPPPMVRLTEIPADFSFDLVLG